MTLGRDDRHTADLAPPPWHALVPADCLTRLSTTSAGLAEREADKRLKAGGPNILPRRGRLSGFTVILNQFRNPLIYLLLLAAVISLSIGEVNDAILIVGVLIINAAIGSFQEWKAETSAEALESMVPIRAVVLRDGQKTRRPSADLVPGDVVELESGDSTPADIRLLQARELRVDEAALTGESVPIDKLSDAEIAADVAVADRLTMVYAGSTVLAGRASGVVVATGIKTEIGRIAEALTREKDTAPPLVQRLERFTKMIGVAVIGLMIVIGITQITQGVPLEQVFFLAVALAVSAVPEGLPVAITVALSIGSNRMARRNVIVRALPAVEGLGACTVIASDKTGTLTCNELVVARAVLPDGDMLRISGTGYEPVGEVTFEDRPAPPPMLDRLRAIAECGALCNEATLRKADGGYVHLGDTVDVAFLALAGKIGVDRAELVATRPQTGFIAFEPHRRFAASINLTGETPVASVKGAAEVVLPMCRDQTELLHHRAEALAAAGYRVLALAAGSVAGDDPSSDLKDLEFLGLVGLIDPVRPEVPEAVQRCVSAGIGVRMVTGDHPETALAIARDIGISTSRDEVVTGLQLSELDARPEARDTVIRKARVFARVEPTQKLQIVNTLQAADEVVAVTGDGVNDAPALRTADIGVAMGVGGTDVARGAADLILSDDNFSSIVNGVEEGRISYENVRRVTLLLISTGLAEIVLFLATVFTGLPLPMYPAQLLWLNLVTNGVQDVMLAFEKGDPRVLNEPPRAPDTPIFERRMIEQTLIAALFMGAAAYAVFAYFLAQGWSETEARSTLILMMVLFENVHVLNCRSEYRSVFKVPVKNNPWVVASVFLTLGLHLIVTYNPGLAGFLRLVPVPMEAWIVIVPPVLGLVAVKEFYKVLRQVPGR